MYLCRCHSLEEEPTEKKKKKKSQALQQAIFTLTFTVLILSLGGIVVASLEWGCFGCTYIPMCLCGSLSFCGGGLRGVFFVFFLFCFNYFIFQVLFLKRNKCIHLFVKTSLLFVQLHFINDTFLLKKKKEKKIVSLGENLLYVMGLQSVLNMCFISLPLIYKRWMTR